MSQWIILDFTCPVHGKFEKLCDKRDGENRFANCDDHLPGCPPCFELSPRVECYAVVGRMKLGEVTQGRNHESDRPAHILDTRDLGDGMSMTEWESKNDIKDRDERHRDVKEMMA